MTRKLDDDKKAVDIAVHVDAGPVYTVGQLNLVGLELQGEAESKRMWGLKLGQPFNPDYPDRFLARVREDGVFDHLGKTKAEMKVDEKKHEVDVPLTFGVTPPAPAKPPVRKGRGGWGMGA